MSDSSMTELPSYLKRYIVIQNQDRYTPLDQAVWRYILRQLKSYLGQHAHESYLDGLSQTGISTEKIPLIKDISERLSKFGWRALPVSGFIPPAAFMELQSLGILPIASDMRTLDHLLYTPAPDIVHEAAGHAPLLVNKNYSNYLKEYAQIAKKALISKEDMNVYRAIRDLSDIKENPNSTDQDIATAEKNLIAANSAITHVSEAALLSRMNWWTAEYGLIGDLNSPKIIGAGLLSSVGESELCLSDSVKKIPLSIDCINYSYDITEPQPQLFVAKDFQHMLDVLHQMAKTMAFQAGGFEAVSKAILAETVNTVEFDTGLQIGGICKSQIIDSNKNIAYLSFEGPCQLATDFKQLPGQGKDQHPHGFGTPVGTPVGINKSLWSFKELAPMMTGTQIELKYPSGVSVRGEYVSHLEKNGALVVLTLTNATAELNGSILFDPSWGTYDMAIGSTVTSVFAGPADRSAYGETDDFNIEMVPEKKFTDIELKKFRNYQCVSDTRNWIAIATENQFADTDKSQLLTKLKDLDALMKTHRSDFPQDWLFFLELYEMSYSLSQMSDLQFASQMVFELKQILKTFESDSKKHKLIQDGQKEVHKQTLFSQVQNFTRASQPQKNS